MGRVTCFNTFTLALLLISARTSHQGKVLTSEYDEDDDDYYDDPPQIHNKQEKGTSTSTNPKPFSKVEEKVEKDASKTIKNYQKEITTKKPIPTYEVTELVIDVPDTSTKKPIFNNFTVVKPLNLADVAGNQINTFDTKIKDEGDEVINAIFLSDKPSVKTEKTTKKPDQNVKGRSSKPEESKNRKFNTDSYNTKDNFYKDTDNDSNEDEFIDFDYKDEPKSIKDFFHSLKKDIVTGFKSVIDKDDKVSDSFHKFVDTPITILSILHRKTTDIVDKFHKSVSKHKHDDEVSFDLDDDCEY